MSESIICIQKLSKYFGNTVALRDIDLEIKRAEIFGLLGPNGAGKTTLIRCIIQLIKPNEGEILFKDRPLINEDIQQCFGFLPENFHPPENLTAKEWLGILSWGLKLDSGDVNSCLEQVGLKEQKDKPIKAYSRGMIQRLGLAVSLLKQPEVIILDEPTLGLDPLGQTQILEFLVNLHKQDKTIFFSSHNLLHIEKVCDRIGLIHQGKLRFVGRIKELNDKHKSNSLEEAFLKEIRQ